MQKEDLQKTLNSLVAHSPKRNFTQAVDFIITLKDLDLKKSENQVDVFHELPHPKGKTNKICGLVGGELIEQSKETFDHTIASDDFKSIDKKQAKKLASTYDFFVAQATIMPQVATAFGRVFGPRGKMPNPKAGCVVPPNANLKPLKQKLGKTVRLHVLKEMIIQLAVGKQDTSVEDLTENILSVYNALVHALPKEHHNIKNTFVKLTMGPAVPVGQQLEAPQEHTEPAKEGAKA